MHGDSRQFWYDIVNSKISTRIFASDLKIFRVSYPHEFKGEYVSVGYEAWSHEGVGREEV